MNGYLKLDYYKLFILYFITYNIFVINIIYFFYK